MSIKVGKITSNILANFSLILPFILGLIIVGVLYYVNYKNNKINIEGYQNNDYYPGGMNNVDQILFINLDNRKDRLEAITSQLKSQKVNMDKVHRITAHYTPGNGHLGCAKSHLDAIKYASEMGYENIIVLEDDFKFAFDSKTTHQVFDKLFKNVKLNEWDVILLTHVHGKTVDTKYPFIKKITDAQTGSGYIVNKSYYPIMMSIFEKCVANMSKDKTRTSGVNWEQWALDQVWKENQREDRWFTFDPLLGKQDEELVSTIQTITNYNTNTSANTKK
jgi:GR25 family glycosyltransferase involved in LPS biosynthesis